MLPIIAPEVDELLQHAVDFADPRDEESMLACTPALLKLQSDRTFISNMVKNRILNMLRGESTTENTPQAMLLGTKRREKVSFTARAVVWSPPLTRNSRSLDLQDSIYSYKTPHDHNFSLLTVGYSGPGYSTRIWQYDRSSMVGEIGEAIALTEIGIKTLGEGEIIYYHPLRDVHAQYHPNKTSISLNLIGHHYDLSTKAQFEFDVENQKIKRILPGNIADIEALPFRIIQALGADEETIQVLKQMCEDYPVESSQLAAFNTLAHLVPSDVDKLRNLARRSVNTLVRQWGNLTGG